jgi:6-phosphofructokinase 1
LETLVGFPELKPKLKIKSLGVLTSGGDAPGMNAAIRAVVRYATAHGIKVRGIFRGYSGIFERQMVELGPSSVSNIIQRGGTILKTDRCEAFFKKALRAQAFHILQSEGIEGVIVIGGDGSFTGAQLFSSEHPMPMIGIPGTIDNDIPGTDDAIGFDTAVNTAIEAIDRIRDTASSHNRTFLIEVMGRSSGFIALQVAIAGGAEVVVLPEVKASMKTICDTIEQGKNRGKSSSIVIVAEGMKPGCSNQIAAALGKRGLPARVCILGHTQRGGSPTTHDRVLASKMGAAAVAHLVAGVSQSMIAVQQGAFKTIPFDAVIGKRKPLLLQEVSLAHILA